MRGMVNSATSATSRMAWRRLVDSGCSERTLFAVAAIFVILRALVYLVFEQVAFDSDQAVVGLMAKHLMEGRAFPLFYYGLTYMLGVEAWTAVPFFVVAGPTVLALRLSLLAWNLAFVFLIIAGVRRAAGLATWDALVPALFFVAAPVSVSRQLISAQGGNIEPFVYIGLLWFLRRYPLWFGAVLAIGFRNREFTLYAAPVLLVLDLITGELDRTRAREWLTSLAMFCAVWETIEALKPFADFLGPGTRGHLLGGFSGSQISNLTDRFDWQVAALGERARRIGAGLLAWFSGARQVDSSLPIHDRPWLAWSAGLSMLWAAGRLTWLLVRPRAAPRSDFRFVRELAARVTQAEFAFYVLGVGAVAVAGFVAGKPDLPGYSRYVLLGLLVPIGVTAALLRLESRRTLRWLVTGLVAAWAVLMMVDHGDVLVTYVRNPPPNLTRDMAEHLVARQIPVAVTGYWGAYTLSFIARERARVASRDVVRVQEYQDLFLAPSSRGVLLSETACPGGEHIARWYVCEP